MSAFEADRFNHSRTSPEAAISRQPSAISQSRSLTTLGMTRPCKDLASERLTTVSKERLQHFRAAAGQHSAANLDLVVQLRMVHDGHHRMHRARFWVVRAINQA